MGGASSETTPAFIDTDDVVCGSFRLKKRIGRKVYWTMTEVYIPVSMNPIIPTMPDAASVHLMTLNSMASTDLSPIPVVAAVRKT